MSGVERPHDSQPSGAHIAPLGRRLARVEADLRVIDAERGALLEIDCGEGRRRAGAGAGVGRVETVGAAAVAGRNGRAGDVEHAAAGAEALEGGEGRRHGADAAFGRGDAGRGRGRGPVAGFAAAGPAEPAACAAGACAGAAVEGGLVGFAVGPAGVL